MDALKRLLILLGNTSIDVLSKDKILKSYGNNSKKKNIIIIALLRIANGYCLLAIAAGRARS